MRKCVVKKNQKQRTNESLHYISVILFYVIYVTNFNNVPNFTNMSKKNNELKIVYVSYRISSIYFVINHLQLCCILFFLLFKKN